MKSNALPKSWGDRKNTIDQDLSQIERVVRAMRLVTQRAFCLSLACSDSNAKQPVRTEKGFIDHHTAMNHTKARDVLDTSGSLVFTQLPILDRRKMFGERPVCHAKALPCLRSLTLGKSLSMVAQ
jgi:hypothetical protein